MIRVEKIDTWGIEHAIRGMRNPMNSWDNSDSYDATRQPYFRVGANDLALMRKLYNAGTEHRKYLRQIFVSMDITAPLYWWKEFDTYKVGTVSNSCSTMHKIHAKEFELDDFSHEHIEVGMSSDIWLNCLHQTIEILNIAREEYLKSGDKNYWWQMIQLLPSSYNQKRTITMNYENVVSILTQRSAHKLDEWRDFCKILKEDVPYIEEITNE